jgi:hypothetical protein
MTEQGLLANRKDRSQTQAMSGQRSVPDGKDVAVHSVQASSLGFARSHVLGVAEATQPSSRHDPMLFPGDPGKRLVTSHLSAHIAVKCEVSPVRPPGWCRRLGKAEVAGLWGEHLFVCVESFGSGRF